MALIAPYSMDYTHWHLSEKTHRVVAESGIPSDRYHIGKILLRCFKDEPDCVLQIDAQTGEKENFSSVLRRSIQCAESLKKLGLTTGDVVVLMGRNHLDMCIPFYAALYLGLPISSTADAYKLEEYVSYLKNIKPKLIFCQNENVNRIKPAIDELGLDTKIIIFEDENTKSQHAVIHFKNFMEDGGKADVENFKANDFDPTKVYGIIQSTSGTCGLPKAAALTHKNLIVGTSYINSSYPEEKFLNIPFLLWAPVQWISCLTTFICSPIYLLTRIQTSAPLTIANWFETVRKYRPMVTVMSPTYVGNILKAPQRDNFDFSCFLAVTMGGNSVSPTLCDEVKQLMPKAMVTNGYAMSESCTVVFFPPGQPRGSCGSRMAYMKYRLVDPNTGTEIIEPHVSGELWLKGPTIFQGYYNNPEGTAASFSEDGWFKTGDLFYRDEQYYFYFVERVKLMFKYMSHHITPAEIEHVIRRHPGVIDVAVTGIPDPDYAELPAALVVTRKGHQVTAQEIKDIVEENLSDPKKLRGGVVFVDSIPMSNNMKPDQKKIKELAMTLEKL